MCSWFELIDENTLTFVALHELSYLYDKNKVKDATLEKFKYLIEYSEIEFIHPKIIKNQ